MKRKDSKIKKVGSTILVASAILTSANSKAQVGDVHIEEDDSNSSKQEINKEKTFPIIKKDSLELETRLKEIAKEPYNGKLAMGAMCYIGGVFKKEDTICPICNEKMPLTWWEEKDLPKIISIVNQIKQAGYDVVLDCDHSNNDKEKDEYLKNHLRIIFKIRFSKNSAYHEIETSNIVYYNCLLSFLQNKKTFLEEQDEETTLHSNVKIIQQMTGLGKDMILKKHYFCIDYDKNGNLVRLWLNKQEFIKRMEKKGKSEIEIKEELENQDYMKNYGFFVGDGEYEEKL
jgi:hypothetical protein